MSGCGRAATHSGLQIGLQNPNHAFDGFESCETLL